MDGLPEATLDKLELPARSKRNGWWDADSIKAPLCSELCSEIIYGGMLSYYVCVVNSRYQVMPNSTKDYELPMPSLSTYIWHFSFEPLILLFGCLGVSWLQFRPPGTTNNN